MAADDGCPSGSEIKAEWWEQLGKMTYQEIIFIR
jgi:hypothetical protein